MTGYELIWTLYFCYTVWFLWSITDEYYTNIFDLVCDFCEEQVISKEKEKTYQAIILLLNKQLKEQEETLELMRRLP